MEMKEEGGGIEKQSVMETDFLDCQKTVLQLFPYDEYRETKR